MDVTDVRYEIELSNKRIKCDYEIRRLVEEIRFTVGYKIKLRNGKEYRIDKACHNSTLSEDVILSLLCYKYLYTENKLHFVKYVQGTTGKLNELGMLVVECNRDRLAKELTSYLSLVPILVPNLIMYQDYGDTTKTFVEI